MALNRVQRQEASLLKQERMNSWKPEMIYMQRESWLMCGIAVHWVNSDYYNMQYISAVRCLVLLICDTTQSESWGCTLVVKDTCQTICLSNRRLRDKKKKKRQVWGVDNDDISWGTPLLIYTKFTWESITVYRAIFFLLRGWLIRYMGESSQIQIGFWAIFSLLLHTPDPDWTRSEI